jgi:hypothetical protein
MDRNETALHIPASPLVGMRIGIITEKNAVAVAAWQVLQRQCDQIAEAPFRHGVLTRK